MPKKSKSKKSTWADVKKHDVVEMSGRDYRVVKIKAGKKKAEVMVEYKGRYISSKVKLVDRVKISKDNGGSKKGPLYDAEGNARRWATKREAAEVGVGLPAGDSSQTAPPAKAGKDPWTDPKPGVETMLGDLLNARLVAETPDEEAGYYIPPVNVSTVASHLMLFHGGIPDAVLEDEGRMLGAHEAQHAEALKGSPLAVNHWHTPTRPKM